MYNGSFAVTAFWGVILAAAGGVFGGRVLEVNSTDISLTQLMYNVLTYNDFDPVFKVDFAGTMKSNPDAWFFDPVNQPLGCQLIFFPFASDLANVNIDVNGLEYVFSSGAASSFSFPLDLNQLPSKKLTVAYKGVAGHWFLVPEQPANITLFCFNNEDYMEANLKLVVNSVQFRLTNATLTSANSLSLGTYQAQMIASTFDVGFGDFWLQVDSPAYAPRGNSNAFAKVTESDVKLSGCNLTLNNLTVTVNGSQLLLSGMFRRRGTAMQVCNLTIDNFLAPPPSLPLQKFTFSLVNAGNPVIVYNQSLGAPNAVKLALTNDVPNLMFQGLPSRFGFTVSVAFAIAFEGLGFGLKTEDSKGDFGVFNVTFTGLNSTEKWTLNGVKFDRFGSLNATFPASFQPDLSAGMHIEIAVASPLWIGVFSVTFQLFSANFTLPFTQPVTVPFTTWQQLSTPLVFAPTSLEVGQNTNVRVQARFPPKLSSVTAQMDLQLNLTGGMRFQSPSDPVTISLNFPLQYSKLQYNQNTNSLILTNVSLVSLEGVGSYVDFTISGLRNSVSQVSGLSPSLSVIQSQYAIWSVSTLYDLNPVKLTTNCTGIQWSKQPNFSVKINVIAPFYVTFDHFLAISFSSNYTFNSGPNGTVLASDIWSQSELQAMTSVIHAAGGGVHVLVSGFLKNAIPGAQNWISLSGAVNATVLPSVDTVTVALYSVRPMSDPQSLNPESLLSPVSYNAMSVAGCPENCLQCQLGNFLCLKCWNNNFYLAINRTACLGFPDPAVSNYTLNSADALGTINVTAYAIERAFCALSYTVLAIVVISSLVLRPLTRNPSAFPVYPIAILCGASGVKNGLYLAHNVFQWSAFGFQLSAPIFVCWALNAALVALLFINLGRKIGNSFRLMNIRARSLPACIVYLILGVGTSFWMLAVRVPSFLETHFAGKDAVDVFRRFLSNLLIANLLLVICTDLTVAVLMFAYLPAAIEANVLLIVNVVAVTLAHLWYYQQHLENEQGKLAEAKRRLAAAGQYTEFEEQPSGIVVEEGSLDSEASLNDETHQFANKTRTSLLKERIFEQLNAADETPWEPNKTAKEC